MNVENSFMNTFKISNYTTSSLKTISALNSQGTLAISGEKRSVVKQINRSELTKDDLFGPGGLRR